MGGLGRLAAVALLCWVALAVGGAGPAAAHTELTGSTPGANSTLAGAPEEVSLTFSEPVTLADDPVAVTGPGGEVWAVEEAVLDGTVLTAAVEPQGPAGSYLLTYRVHSSDGHLLTGTVPFTLTEAVPEPGIPAWVWIVGGVVVLIAGLLLLDRDRKQKT